MTFENVPVFLFESIISSLVPSLKCYCMNANAILPETAGVTKKKRKEKDTVLLITKTTTSFFFFLNYESMITQLQEIWKIQNKVTYSSTIY